MSLLEDTPDLGFLGPHLQKNTAAARPAKHTAKLPHTAPAMAPGVMAEAVAELEGGVLLLPPPVEFVLLGVGVGEEVGVRDEVGVADTPEGTSWVEDTDALGLEVGVGEEVSVLEEVRLGELPGEGVGVEVAVGEGVEEGVAGAPALLPVPLGVWVRVPLGVGEEERDPPVVGDEVGVAEGPKRVGEGVEVAVMVAPPASLVGDGVGVWVPVGDGVGVAPPLVGVWVEVAPPLVGETEGVRLPEGVNDGVRERLAVWLGVAERLGVTVGLGLTAARPCA